MPRVGVAIGWAVIGWIVSIVGLDATADAQPPAEVEPSAGSLEFEPPNAERRSIDVAQLAARIDELIARRWAEENTTAAPPADDAEFLRRVYLDLVGKIPSVSEVREFLADETPDKRRRVVDRLIDGPAHVVHFSRVWRDIMLPDADADIQSRFLQPSFEAWLRNRFAENTPYDDLVRELLTLPFNSGGGNGQAAVNLYAANGQATPVAFYQTKQFDPGNLAAATSRVFLGVRIECAQCHDHPFDQWKRSEFWSFAAFFASLERTNPNQGAFGPVNENAARREIKIPDTEQVVPATFLGGSSPRWQSDEERPRDVLADWIVLRDNPYFARTAVNRYWRHFFGVGLVEPADDFSENNPPSHPELLDLLADEFASHDFDTQFLLRAIVATNAYQLSSRQTDDSQSDPRRFARMAPRGMTAEQLYDSLSVAIGRFDSFTPQRFFTNGMNDPRGEFLELFRTSGSLSPHDSETTILQALAMMNGQIVADATDLPKSKTLAAVIEYPGISVKQRIETLYLATLSRPPTKEELDRLVAHVRSSGDSRQSLADIFWALLNSSEFLLNH